MIVSFVYNETKTKFKLFNMINKNNKMNKILSLVVIFAVSIFTSINAQNLSSGMIVQELTDIKADDPAIKMQMDMMKGSTNTVYFNNNKVLTEVDMMGGMMKMKTLTNTSDKSGYLLFDLGMLGLKNKVNISAEDVQKSEDNMDGVTVTYDKSDTKEILGYKCHKAIISSPEMQGAEITVYVTEEISITADIIQGISGDKINGFPLEYSIGAPGMQMVYSTVEIKDKVDASVFNINTDGYEEMTMEEFQKQMSSMGGMGF